MPIITLPPKWPTLLAQLLPADREERLRLVAGLSADEMEGMRYVLKLELAKRKTLCNNTPYAER